MQRWSALVLGAVLAWGAFSLRAATRGDVSLDRFDHGALGRILGEVVRDARVDYVRLKARTGELDVYLDRIAAVPASEFAAWPRAERLALLLNLYNARTLRLIVEHYPLGSIREIGLLPGAAWKQKIVRFGGRVVSLDDLEHGIVRKEYAEPRVHFALVCAAKGCPPLRAEPYRGAELERQLADQGRRFLSETNKNRFDVATRTLWLSPIFDWFAEDFRAGGGTVTSFVKPFLGAEVRRALEAFRDSEIRVRFTDYDWSLNDVARP